MQVIDLAQDLNVAPDGLVLLLRELGIHVSGADTEVSEADVSRILARIERERRSGHKRTAEALEAAIEDAQSARKPRRRRRVARTATKPADAEDEATEETASQLEGDEGDEGALEGDAEEGAVGGHATGAQAEAGAEAEVGEDPGEMEEAEASTDGGTDAEEPAPDVVNAEAGDEGQEELADATEEGEDAEPEFDEPELAELEMETDEGIEPSEPAPKPEPVRRLGPEGPARVIRKPVSSPAASAVPGGQVRIQAEGYTSDGRKKSKKDKKGKKRARVDQDAVQSNIQRVMAELKGSGKKRRGGRDLCPREKRSKLRRRKSVRSRNGSGPPCG